MRWRSHRAAKRAVAGSETQGIDNLAIADVAASAGVHETSIYRRWGTRENPIVAALLDDSTTKTSILDTGSAREDLIVDERADTSWDRVKII